MGRLASVFTGLMHLQLLTGFMVLFTRPFYTGIFGHLAFMLLAAVVAQFTTSVVSRRPARRKTYGPHLVGGAMALLCMVAGIDMIGRGVLESTM